MVRLSSLTIIVSICATVWFTRSIPPLPLGYRIRAGGIFPIPGKPEKTACEKLESMLRGYPPRGIYLLVRTLALPLAVKSADVTANMSARRPNRPVKNKM